MMMIDDDKDGASHFVMLHFQIVSMGFNIDAIKEALKRFGGNSRKAIEELVSTGGVLPSCSSHGNS